jgi:hypothetical protein
MTKKITEVRFSREETRKSKLLAAALWDNGSLQELIVEHSKEDSSKLLMLCQHYGIQASTFMFYDLALALAREIYPEPETPGRKSKWTALNKGALVVEVERLVKPGDRAHGIKWACNQLAKRELWKAFIEIKESDITEPDSAEVLRQIYFAFRADKWAMVLRDTFKRYEHQSAIAEWDEHVIDFVRNPHPK